MKSAAALALLLLGCAASNEPGATAKQIASADETVGGPVGYGRVGDFLLENGKIRAVVEQGGRSKLPLDIGGTLIDLDLVRQDARFRGGKGLDQLGQIAPIGNLFLAKALGEKSVRITSPGDIAEVTASGEAGPAQKILDALGLLIRRDFAGNVDHSRFRLYTEYRLHPGEQLLRIRTTVGFDVAFCPARPDDNCNAACDDILYDADCECPRIPARCSAGVTKIEASALPDRPGQVGIADILLGDLPRPVGSGACVTTADCNAALNETCTDITTGLGGTSRVCRGPAARDPGVFFGDILLFGGHLTPFLPGTGFDTETDIRRLFDSGEDTLSNPLKIDAVFAIGKGVSYGYAPPSGKVLIPVFGGPFSMGATGATSCRHDQPGCLASQLMRSERWVSVGSGDAASAAEVLLTARGEKLGEVRGVVLKAHSPEPVVGAEVFALKDPRDFECDAACVARCGDVPDSFNFDELIALNRCRSRDGTYLEGQAGIVSQAKADPFGDPTADGAFRLPLQPGRYVLVAQDERKARSELVRVEVTEGAAVSVALQVVEPGRLVWTIANERGEKSAGRITVGQCLPGAPCGNDTDCGEGEVCRAGGCSCARTLPWPIEFGGGRLEDGVHAFDQTHNGRGELLLAPGEYDVLFSRGPHATVDHQRVRVFSNQTTEVRGTVARAVSRNGWTSADFHVHAAPSMDSGLELQKRVQSFLAEDVDFLSASDHDVLTDYLPLIQRMGVREQLGTQVGCEVTTQELGHFIGYPLRYQQFTADPEPQRVQQNGAPEWRDKTPGEIFAAIRAAGPEDGHMIVSVPHPYTYFDFYGIDPVTLEPRESVLSLLNPLVKSVNFSGEFDAMEIINSKSLDLIRRPTIGEAQFFSEGSDALLKARRSGRLSESDYQKQLYELSTETARRILHRAPGEQSAARAGAGAQLPCSCASNGDCSAGRVCDKSQLRCVSPQDVSNGAPPPPDGMCRSLRGVIDDWFVMLNRGLRRTGVGGSDVHGLFGYEAGSPRTMIKTGGTTTPFVQSDLIVQGVLDGRVVVTNGPMLDVELAGKGVGEVVRTNDATVPLHVKVQTGGWYDVDRVEIYRNGELIHWLNSCTSRRPGDAPDGHDHPCIDVSKQTTVPVDVTFDEAPVTDSWYVVIALGLDGRTLSPVYQSQALARFGTFEIAQRIYDIIPTLSTLRTPRFPSLYPTFPVAISNPIWLDRGGDGWKPSLPPPSWCRPERDFGCPRR